MQQLMILLVINSPSACLGRQATYSTQCTQLASRLSNIRTVTT